jgi:hypothetical protein
MDPFGNDLPLWAEVWKPFYGTIRGLWRLERHFAAAGMKVELPWLTTWNQVTKALSKSYLASLWTHDFPSSLRIHQVTASSLRVPGHLHVSSDVCPQPWTR